MAIFYLSVPSAMNLLVKLGTFALLVIVTWVGLMLLISLADRHVRKDGTHEKRDRRS